MRFEVGAMQAGIASLQGAHLIFNFSVQVLDDAILSFAFRPEARRELYGGIARSVPFYQSRRNIGYFQAAIDFAELPRAHGGPLICQQDVIGVKLTALTVVANGYTYPDQVRQE